MVEQILAAVFVIALLFVTVWMLRRKGLAVANSPWKRKGRSSSMQTVERLQLTAQHSLHLVRLGDELILVGVSPSSCEKLSVVKSAPCHEEMRAAI